VRWVLEKSGKFSKKYLYKFILNPGIKDVRMLDMWAANYPFKQKSLLVVL
jgi:hypothetical protein